MTVTFDCVFDQQQNTVSSKSTSLNILPKELVKVTQRKARYSDKNRVRRKDAKREALLVTGCSSTAEVGFYLKKLGYKIDLRMTAGWLAVKLQYRVDIKRLKLEFQYISPIAKEKDVQTSPAIETQVVASPFKKSDRVRLIYNSNYPLIESQGGDLVVWDVQGDRVQLEYFAPWIPFDQLELVS